MYSTLITASRFISKASTV